MSLQTELERRFLLQEEFLGTDKPVNNIHPLVSVRVATYQHANYIAQCLDSIVNQVTNFPFEVIVGDDGSVDGTTQICMEYAEKYPDKIRLFIRDRELSQYFEDGKFVCRFNSRWVSMSCRGKYIAICEGDDYWKDMFKLQKQADALASDPEVGITHGDCDQLFEDGHVKHAINRQLITDYKDDKNLLFDLLINGAYKVRTASVMYKADIVESVKDDLLYCYGRFVMGDTPLWLLLSQITKFHYIDEVLSVYRISRNSLSRPDTKEKRHRFQLAMIEMRIYFLNRFNKEITDGIKKRYNHSLLLYKAYDPLYQEHYPLFSPSYIEGMLFKNIDNVIAKRFLVVKSRLDGLIKKLR